MYYKIGDKVKINRIGKSGQYPILSSLKLGDIGTVLRVYSDGEIIVEFSSNPLPTFGFKNNQSNICPNNFQIEKVDTMNYKIGDKFKISKFDVTKESKGSFSKLKQLSFDDIGECAETHRNGNIRITFYDGCSFWFNNKLEFDGFGLGSKFQLTKIEDEFKVGDVVELLKNGQFDDFGIIVGICATHYHCELQNRLKFAISRSDSGCISLRKVPNFKHTESLKLYLSECFTSETPWTLWEYNSVNQISRYDLNKHPRWSNLYNYHRKPEFKVGDVVNLLDRHGNIIDIGVLEKIDEGRYACYFQDRNHMCLDSTWDYDIRKVPNFKYTEEFKIYLNEYCKQTPIPWIYWERKDGKQLTTHPDWLDSKIGFQRKPEKKFILVNGIKVPAPETKKPEMGTYYYMYDVMLLTIYVWANDDWDNEHLSLGLVYLNKEDAIARAKAMLKFEEIK